MTAPAGTAEDRVWLVPPRSSPLAGVALSTMGAIALASAAWDIASAPTDGLLTLVLRAGFPSLLGALLLLTGAMVRALKGGMSVDRRSRALALYGRSERDRLVLEPNQLTRGRLTWRDRPQDGETERLWALELETSTGATVLIGEGPVRDELLDVLRALAPDLPCPVEETAEPAGPGPLPPHRTSLPDCVGRTSLPGGARLTFAVQGPWALSGVLTLLGTLSLLVGALLMAHVADAPLSGFLFGPSLAVLGAVLLLVSLTKALAVEEVDVVEGAVAHRFRIMGRSFAERRVTRGEPGGAYARLRPRGAQGTCLEIVASGGSLLGASGVTSGTRGLDLPALLALAGALTQELA